jgi:pimeloyl-ACP methyl ester carboxylesterase
MSNIVAPKVNVVLVHGAWTDGSSWSSVIPILLEKSIPVLAVQLPLTSIDDDTAVTERAIAGLAGPIVLVGHSWGGVAITQAGGDPKVAALVYIAAFAPKEGETGGDLVNAYDKPPALGTIVDDGHGFLRQTEQGMLENVGPDLPAADARVLAVTQGPLPASAFGNKVTKAAWRTKPSWYAISANDRVVNPQLQREFAKQMSAKTTVLQSGHMSLLSHPVEVAGIIEAAVVSVT